jgi:hypothetical protein
VWPGPSEVPGVDEVLQRALGQHDLPGVGAAQRCRHGGVQVVRRRGERRGERLGRTSLPPGRTVVEVCLTDAGRRYWLLLHPDAVDVCRTDPGLPVDLTVAASAAELYRVVQGWRLGKTS